MQVAKKDCTHLDKETVQAVNRLFANPKKQMMRHFKGGSEHGIETASRTAAAEAGVDLSAFAPAAVDAVRPRKDQRRVPWEQLHEMTRYRRLQTATDAFRNSFWPFLMAALSAVDADGEDMHVNDVFALLLSYGIQTANKKNRLAEGLSLPACLPEGVQAELMKAGRAELEAEQRRDSRVDSREEWLHLKSSGGITEKAWNGVRRLLPPHVMPSLYQMRKDSEDMLKRFKDRVKVYRTFSGFQFCVPTMLQLILMSNLIKFCTGCCALVDNVFFLAKLLIDGFIADHINIRHLIAAHLNLGLLPMDTGVMMTDLLATDKERRDCNPSGQEGVSSTTLAVCLGTETWSNMAANFTQSTKIDSLCDLLGLEEELRQSDPKTKVEDLVKLCDLFHISKSKDGGRRANKPALVAKLLSYIERNRGLLAVEHFVPTQKPDLGQDSWYDNLERVPDGESLLDTMDRYDGASFEARVPVLVQNSPKGRQEWAKGEDGLVQFRVVSGRIGSTYHLDMKCQKTMLRWGGCVCRENCLSRMYGASAGDARAADEPSLRGGRLAAPVEEGCDSDAEAAPFGEDDGFVPGEAADEHLLRPGQAQAGPAAATSQARPARRVPIPGAEPKCGKCCPCCDTPSHNHRRPLQFMELPAIVAQMGLQAGSPVTLGQVADYYKISVAQLVRWSTSAFRPDDLAGGPRCSCPFVQRETFGYTGFDITIPRRDDRVEARTLRCSVGNAAHQRQRLLTTICACETAAQAPTLGLWKKPQDLSADTILTELPALQVPWAPEAKIPLVLAVRHLWQDVMSGAQPLHETLTDPLKHVAGYLHAVLLALPRSVMHTVSRIAEGKSKLDTFNTQNAPLWSAEYVKESKKLAEPTFHGPTAKAIIARYAACIERDEASDRFTLKDKEGWPLRGIVDDTDPNLHHLLAMFWWLNVEIGLAAQLFLRPEQLAELFHATLEVTIRLRAISVFGAGYPHYAHYHLHAPWQILAGGFQGWRFVSEEIGEALHKVWKALSLHTTRGGAGGRLGAKRNRGAAAGPLDLTCKEQRVKAGDMNALHQMIRRYVTKILATHKTALNWFDTMQREHPGVDVIKFNTGGKQRRSVPLGLTPSTAVTFTPYDVVDRLGRVTLVEAPPARPAGGSGTGRARAGAMPPQPPPPPTRPQPTLPAWEGARAADASAAVPRTGRPAGRGRGSGGGAGRTNGAGAVAGGGGRRQRAGRGQGVATEAAAIRAATPDGVVGGAWAGAAQGPGVTDSGNSRAKKAARQEHLDNVRNEARQPAGRAARRLPPTLFG